MTTRIDSAAIGPRKRELLARLLAQQGIRTPRRERLGPRAERGPCPLSFAQQRLWFLHQLEPDSPAYNLPVALRLRGSLDARALGRALNALVERHEVLRTRFVAPDGQPLQDVLEHLQVELACDDLGAVARAEREPELRRRLKREAAAPFDLALGPLLRARLYRLDTDDHALLLTLHHAVSDGWSLGLMLQELATLYGELAAGTAVRLPPLPVQYADYAVWQRGWLSGEMLDAQLTYWTRQLADAPVLELPLDRPRCAGRGRRGARHLFGVPAGTARALKELSRREGATLFMTLLAAFQALLSRWSGQVDIGCGTPVAGRSCAEVEPLIGFFVNTLVLRTDLRGDPGFVELLRRVREVALRAYAHQDVPFEQVVDRVQPARRLDHTPLFQVMFEVAARAPGADVPLPLPPWLTATTQEFELSVPKFDLSVIVGERGDELAAAIGYDADLFEATTIERLARSYGRLLESVATDSQRALSRLPLLDDGERRQVLVEWNCPASGWPEACVHALFEQQAQRTPDAPAVSCEGRQLSYAELDARANQLARRLRRRGVGPDARVGLCLERSLDMVVSILAILKAGGAYVPVDPAYPQQHLRFVLADAGVALLLTEAGAGEAIAPEGVPVMLLDRERAALAHEDAGPLAVAMAPANLAYVIYTSGSTGRPKGVMIPHCNVVHLMAATREHYRFGPGDTVTLFHSFAFDFSVWELWSALFYGGRLVVVPYWTSRSPEAFRDLLRDEGVTVLNQTPSAFRQLMGVEQGDGSLAGPALRSVIFGGEALEPHGLRPWFERHGGERPRLVNMYGITETTVHVTYRPLSPADAAAGGRGAIGRGLDGWQVYILDRHMELTPIGAVGELYVGGYGLARGYLDRPGLSAERFLPHPFSSEPGARLYRTGDLGRYTAAGDIEYFGRGDQQVKIRGFRIELGELEAELLAQPQVREAVAVAREDAAGERRLVAYVTPRSGGELDLDDLWQRLRDNLPAHMVPASLVVLAALPLTENGKLDRGKLPEPQAQAGGGAEGSARSVVEELLAQIWADVLRLPQVGVHDDFFRLGGHSLLATQVLARLRGVFQVELPLRTLFEAPTVSALAREVERVLQGAPPAEPLVPRPHSGPQPLSYAQQRLWLIQRMDPGSPAYNVPLALRVRGALDLAALRWAAGEIVRRHEILRTTFDLVDGEPLQLVAAVAEVDVPLADLRDHPPDARAAEAERLVQVEAWRPFDLATGPVMRVLVVRLEDTEHVVLLTLHHIVSDGWSLNVLAREFALLYAAAREGRRSPLRELPVQYADYVLWQRRTLTEERLEAQLEHWRGQLAGLQPLALLTDRPRGAQAAHLRASCGVVLPAALSQALGELSRAHGATLYMTLLAAFGVLLGRYAGQDDVALGSPVAHRNRLELEPLIGFFVNTLVVRVDLSGRPTFAQVLRRVRAATLDAHANQDVPFERIVEESAPGRDRARSPLFQAAFALQNAVREELDVAGLELAPVGAAGGRAKFELSLALSEGPDGLRGALEYAAELFEPASMQRLTRHYRRVLEAVVADPQQPVATLPLLDDDERRQVLVEWNRTRSDGRQACVHHLFEEQARRAPQALAVTCAGLELSYAGLNARANRLARHLRRRGIGPDVRVGLLLERSLDLALAPLAVLKAGGAYVPLDPAHPRERLKFLVADAGVTLLLTQGSLRDTLASEELPVVCLDRDWADVAAEDAHDMPALVTPAHLAYVIYTSGSTGQPKGVAVPHAGLSNLVHWHHTAFEITPADRATLVAGPGFDASVWELWPYLAAGASVHVVSDEARVQPEALRIVLEAHTISVSFLPTPIAEDLLSLGREQPPALRLLLTGGDRLRVRPPAGLPFTLVNNYGPTEASVVASSGPVAPEGAVGALPSIGRPVTNTRVYLLDSDLQPVPAGVAGEICIAGAGLARGYLNQPALTAGKFVPDPFGSEPGARFYRTGDLARQRSDGELEFLGRVDEQVKLDGVRIELGEIEAALVRHAAVRQCAVVAVPDDAGAKRLVAFVQSRADVPVGAGELREHLAALLPAAMLPATYVPLDQLPLTPNGKPDRKALLTRGADARRVPYAEPRTATERTLCTLWAEVLRRDRVGLDDHFFEMGGQSLLALRMLAGAAVRLGRQIPVAALFRHDSVRQLAAFFDVATPTVSGGPLVEIRPGTAEGVPLYLIHPIGGSVLCYADLAACLDPWQPLHALEAPAQLALPDERLETLAGSYLDAVARHAGGRRYLLGGWSFGGLVAFEMARHARAIGAPPAALLLLDPTPPDELRKTRWSEAELELMFLRDLIRIVGGTAAGAPLRLVGTGLAERLEVAVQAGWLPRWTDQAAYVTAFEIFCRHVRAARVYSAQSYAGPALLVQSETTRSDAWTPLLAGQAQRQRLACDHYALLRRPQVHGIAALVRALAGAARSKGADGAWV